MKYYKSVLSLLVAGVLAAGLPAYAGKGIGSTPKVTPTFNAAAKPKSPVKPPAQILKPKPPILQPGHSGRFSVVSPSTAGYKVPKPASNTVSVSVKKPLKPIFNGAAKPTK